MRKSFVVILSFVFLASSGCPAFANHKEDVLGAQTQVPQIPPTSEGPGLLLPDSPLFVLDQLKQQMRLFFAFSPEAKAKARSDIAGERMAELRFMLAKNNKPGIDIALQGVSENLQKAAELVAQAQLSGRNVSDLARKINNDIKRKQETLDVLEASDNRELKFKAKAAQEQLLAAKVVVEDALPADEILKEFEEDLHRTIAAEVEQVNPSAERIERQLAVLGEQASMSAKEALKRREEAIKQANGNKSETLQKALEQFEAERKRQESLLKAQEQALQEAKRAIEEAQKASQALRKVWYTTSEIKNASLTETQVDSAKGSSVKK